MQTEGFPRHVVWAFPLATLWTEAEIARDRIRDRIITESILIQAAVIDVLSGGDVLRNAIKELRDE